MNDNQALFRISPGSIPVRVNPFFSGTLGIDRRMAVAVLRSSSGVSIAGLPLPLASEPLELLIVCLSVGRRASGHTGHLVCPNLGDDR